MYLAILTPFTPLPGLLVLTGFLAVGLALIHLLVGRLGLLHGQPRSRWLSLGGGVSVSYVFMHILPDLSTTQTTLQEELDHELAVLDHPMYAIALLGLSAFYGLERTAHISRQQSQDTGSGDVTEIGIFWMHMGVFTLYNAFIGYLLLHQQEPGLGRLVMFAIAMALHFMVNDYGLHEHHKKMYRRVGRWILAAAILAGWGIGTGIQLSEAAISVLFAFLAGGLVLNVLKEELPEDRKSRFWAFAIGALGYAALRLIF